MKTRNALLQGDFWVQTIFGSLLLFCFVSYVGIMIGLWFSMFFGGWQVISAIVFGLWQKDRRRLYYLIGVVVYFLLVTAYYKVEGLTFNDIFRYLLFTIPALLAVVYYVITLRDYKQLKKQVVFDSDEYENILDA
jgi:hypothetical protein